MNSLILPKHLLICDLCNGTGKKKALTKEVCNKCSGQGVITPEEEGET